MPETRRRRSTASAAVAEQSAGLEAYLAPLRLAMRMKTYDVLGRMTIATILREGGVVKTIDFRKEAPTIAMVQGSSELLMITPWPGIPAKWSETNEFCQACLAKCDVCNGARKKACEGFKCGGTGKIPLPETVCDAEYCTKQTGKFNPECRTCGGSGLIKKFADCPVCQGTQLMVCGACHGLGQRPTGVQGGDNSSADFRKPACEKCKGARFAHTEIPVNLSEFINAREGPMCFLGPVIRFILDPVEGGIPQVFDVEPDGQQQGMVIALSNDQPGCEAFILGGVLKQSTRAR